MITLAMAWFLSYADRVNMSVASIPMQAEFGWDETTKGLVMGSVFLGYMSSQLLGGWLVDRVGAARVMGLAVLAFSVLTLITPAAAGISFGTLIAARVALGVAEGFAVPATYAFLGRWSPPTERSRLLAIVVSGATIGAPGGLMLSGVLVENFGWQSAFYVFGLLGLVWAVYWLMTSHETPESHPRISDEEKELLREPASDVGRAVGGAGQAYSHPPGCVGHYRQQVLHPVDGVCLPGLVAQLFQFRAGYFTGWLWLVCRPSLDRHVIDAVCRQWLFRWFTG